MINTSEPESTDNFKPIATLDPLNPPDNSELTVTDPSNPPLEFPKSPTSEIQDNPQPTLLKTEETDMNTPAPETIPPTDYTKRFIHAHQVAKNYSLGSAAVGIIPIPTLDLAALIAIQLKMLHHLAEIYDIPFSKELGKSLISSLLGSILPTGGSIVVSSWLKSVPLIGQIGGAVSVATFGVAATYAISRVFIQHFESGGTFLTFNPEKVREYFQTEFNKGKTKHNAPQ